MNTGLKTLISASVVSLGVATAAYAVDFSATAFVTVDDVTEEAEVSETTALQLGGYFSPATGDCEVSMDIGGNVTTSNCTAIAASSTQLGSFLIEGDDFSTVGITVTANDTTDTDPVHFTAIRAQYDESEDLTGTDTEVSATGLFPPGQADDPATLEDELVGSGGLGLAVAADITILEGAPKDNYSLSFTISANNE